MEKVFQGYVRNIALPISLDNVDSDTYLLLRRYNWKNYSYEVGEVDWRDGRFDIRVQVPDLKPGPKFETQEEWNQKRDFYLKFGNEDWDLFCRGACEGYITEDDTLQCVDSGEKGLMLSPWKKQKDKEEKLERLLMQQPETLFVNNCREVNAEFVEESLQLFKEREEVRYSIERLSELGFKIPENLSAKWEQEDYLVNLGNGFYEFIEDRYPLFYLALDIKANLKYIGLDVGLVEILNGNLWEYYEEYKAGIGESLRKDVYEIEEGDKEGEQEIDEESIGSIDRFGDNVAKLNYLISV